MPTMPTSLDKSNLTKIVPKSTLKIIQRVSELQLRKNLWEQINRPKSDVEDPAAYGDAPGDCRAPLSALSRIRSKIFSCCWAHHVSATNGYQWLPTCMLYIDVYRVWYTVLYPARSHTFSRWPSNSDQNATNLKSFFSNGQTNQQNQQIQSFL